MPQEGTSDSFVERWLYPVPQIMDEILEVISWQFASKDSCQSVSSGHLRQTQVLVGAGIAWVSDSGLIRHEHVSVRTVASTMFFHIDTT